MRGLHSETFVTYIEGCSRFPCCGNFWFTTWGLNTAQMQVICLKRFLFFFLSLWFKDSWGLMSNSISFVPLYHGAWTVFSLIDFLIIINFNMILILSSFFWYGSDLCLVCPLTLSLFSFSKLCLEIYTCASYLLVISKNTDYQTLKIDILSHI